MATDNDLFPGEQQEREDLDPARMTFGTFTPEQEAAILAELPQHDTDEALAASNVTTSLRLPYPLFAALKQRATTLGTTPSSLMRTWIEEQLATQPNPVADLRRGAQLILAATEQLDQAA